MFPGAEEFMNLLEKLSSGAVVFIIDNDINAISGGFDGGCQSGRSGADTYHFTSSHGLPPGQIRSVAMLGFNLHVRFQRFDTGSNVGFAVDNHDTVGAAPDCTEHTPGFVAPGGIAMN